MRRAGKLLLSASVALLALPACMAAGQQIASLSASLTPERLGHQTTIGLAFAIRVPTGGVPSPVTLIEISYPENLGIALSGLGLSTCTQKTLEVDGPAGCRTDSRMGYGDGTAEIQIGPYVLQERFVVAIVRAPAPPEGPLSMLFYAEGHSPLLDEIAIAGQLLPAPAPYGGRLAINVPLVEVLPGGTDASLSTLHAILGPNHLTYYRDVAGRHVPYHPQGVLLPRRCPRHGFRFAANFTFLDGTRATSQTRVPCPGLTRSDHHDRAAPRGRGSIHPLSPNTDRRTARTRSPATRGGPATAGHPRL